MCAKLISPLSDEWRVPAGTGHKWLVKYALAEQVQAYGATILDQFDYPTLIRNMKLLRKNYTDEEIKRGIAAAIWVCDHPFSIKQIKDQIEWRRELLSCEVLASYQNKS